MKKLFSNFLAFLARATIRRYQPKIVGITGSVGKTSTKEAAFAVLNSEHRTRCSQKSYNNELGLLLTILGEETQGRSPFGWLGVIFRAVRRLLVRDTAYPEVLVLEMGADHPGDITYLVGVAPCSIGVLTAIAQTHLQNFGTIEKLAEEKRQIIKHLQPGTVAILNGDDELVAATAVPTGVKKITYGFKPGTMVHGSDMMVSLNHEDLSSLGVSFKLQYEGATVPVRLDGVVGQPAVAAALAAAAIGVSQGMNLIEVSNALRSFSGPPGRLKLLPGFNHTTILDDTYNASPRAALAAVDLLATLPLPEGGRRIAVLGDMAELGPATESGHEEVGQRVASYGIHQFVLVGEHAKLAGEAARSAGMTGPIVRLENAKLAGDYLREHLRPGDIALIKGSQSMRMERAVKAVMAHPEQAGELLVRQSAEWLR